MKILKMKNGVSVDMASESNESNKTTKEESQTDIMLPAENIKEPLIDDPPSSDNTENPQVDLPPPSIEETSRYNNSQAIPKKVAILSKTNDVPMLSPAQEKLKEKFWLQNKAIGIFIAIVVVTFLIWGIDFIFGGGDSSITEEVIRTFLSLLTFIIGFLFGNRETK